MITWSDSSGSTWPAITQLCWPPSVRRTCTAGFSPSSRRAGDPARRLRALDGRIGCPAPFGPGPVVYPDSVTSEQVGEYEPGRGGTSSDGAVGDQLTSAVEYRWREEPAELRGGAERPVEVVDAVDGLVDSRRHVTGPSAWLHAAGRPETVAAVLRR